MLFWAFAFLITVAVVVPLVVALRSARKSAVTGAQSDIAVYKDQLAEVDRDLARGVLTEAEAEAVRTEVSRRLLNADQRHAQDAVDYGRAGPAILVVLLVIGVGGTAIYTWMGAPGYGDMPMAQRLAAIDAAALSRPGQIEAEAQAAVNMPDLPQGDAQFQVLMTQLRTALEDRPDDLRGLTLLAENEARLGNFAAAREAQQRVLELKGDDATPLDLLQAIDIMVFGAGGYVSPEAEELVRRFVSLAPDNGAARYYSGLTLAQNGRPDRAFPIWQRLLAESAPQAPWVPVIEAEIGALAAAAGVTNFIPPRPVMDDAVPSGPSAADIAAAEDMSDEDRAMMIEGMVEGLAARLAEEGGPPADWAQLITALGVLGDTERATAILAEARGVFSDSAEAMSLIDGAAARAGLP